MQMDFDGRDIYLESHGEGPPIILLSGLMMSAKSWIPFLPALTKHNRLILVDLLDQGKSSRMSEGYDLSLQVGVVRRTLDHLGVEQASVAGVSYGASVAMQFALAYPRRVERLVLFNCVAYLSPWLKEVGAGWAAARVSPELYYHMTTPFFYSKSFYNKNLDWIKSRRDFLIERYFGDADFLDATARLTDSTSSHDLRDRLCKIRAKTLVVGGREDILTPLSEQRLVSEQIPGASLVVLEDCGHATLYEKPEAFQTLLAGFVNHESVKI